jgi:hypothetical protein
MDIRKRLVLDSRDEHVTMRVRGKLRNGEVVILPCGARTHTPGVGQIQAFQAQSTGYPYSGIRIEQQSMMCLPTLQCTQGECEGGVLVGTALHKSVGMDAG